MIDSPTWSDFRLDDLGRHERPGRHEQMMCPFEGCSVSYLHYHRDELDGERIVRVLPEDRP